MAETINKSTLASKIAGTTVYRWELGNVFARPGRGRLQPALEGPLGPHRNLHLAGDYFAELGNMEAAARCSVGSSSTECVRSSGETDALHARAKM